VLSIRRREKRLVSVNSLGTSFLAGGLFLKIGLISGKGFEATLNF
jgi:hypothetical protein